ncbi:MbtH family protein [Actinomadura sp. CNU-125]|uniref:MbtH family protein n=1 Tax=Actinomadura sp. CNU-125 TaxID=1904961 RepID=UPI002915C911|nr:MbtH family NRPS accessory protein [Actinomadura sp. CNU-125]
MNPFDDEEGSFLVLANDEGQHSLWPTGVTPEAGVPPAGWHLVHGPGTRVACLEYVRANWTDIRPRSLAARMAASG